MIKFGEYAFTYPTISIFCFSLAVILVIVLTVYYFICKSYKQKVLSTSLRYLEILELNKNYSFYDIDETYYFDKYVNSKSQVERFDFDKFFNEEIEYTFSFFEDIIKQSEYNQSMYSKYCMSLNLLSSLTDKETAEINNVPFWAYRLYEEEAVKNIILNPITNPNFNFKVEYLSPKGRKYYYNEDIFEYEDLLQHIKVVKDRFEFRKTKEYQRSLMTPSLRYDILQRDEFKCVICGRSKADGIKLHVDHIKPVAKGGKTIPENLRTLCNECNSGKSDKYVEDGLN